jgi:hypothetical protein
MTARLVLFLVTVLFLTTTTIVWAQDSGIPDTLRIEPYYLSQLCLPADSLPIYIYLWNDEPICGFTFGLQFDWGPYSVIGFSKAGSIIPPGGIEPLCVCPPMVDSNKICIGWPDVTDSNCISPTDDSIGHLLITVYLRAHSQYIYHGMKVDSLFIPPACQLSFAAENGINFTPQFVSYSSTCLDVNDPQAGEPDESRQAPNAGIVAQNFPNPFNAGTMIDIKIARATAVNIEIFNVKGQRVRTLVNRQMSPGQWRFDWDGSDDRGSDMPSGVYFYRLKAGDNIETKKMVLLK